VSPEDAWSVLIAEGLDKLTYNSINGKGKMPAKGGNMKLTDEEVRAAVAYMMEASK
jgi:cytochrome c5